MAKSTFRLEQDIRELRAQVDALTVVVRTLIEAEDSRQPGMREAIGRVLDRQISQVAATEVPASERPSLGLRAAAETVLKPLEGGSELPRETSTAPRAGLLDRIRSIGR